MSKFKIGDIVVGNSKASRKYGVTVKGVEMEVVEETGSKGAFKGKLTKSVRNGRKGECFFVDSTCFDLKTPAAPPIKAATPSSPLSTDELITEVTKLRKQLKAAEARKTEKQERIKHCMAVIEARVAKAR